MKLSHHFIILGTLILSVTCVLGIDYYDQKETKIMSLYQKVALKGIHYKAIRLELNGTKEGETLDARGIATKESEATAQLAHLPGCSKWCMSLHPHDAICSRLMQQPGLLGIVLENKDVYTPYQLSIKTQDSTTYYQIKIQGLEDLYQFDNLRVLALNLFQRWHVSPKESIAFIGEIDNRLTNEQRKAYVNQIFEAVRARQTGYYLDDSSHDTEAYYAYTKAIEAFILDAEGKKTNIQVCFTYNELLNKTQIIIAFPFYNEPF